MRLKSLYIKNYKNIHEQTFDFSSNDGYIALIGLNGSGKSNLLEAIGMVLDSILNSHQAPFEYKIEYEYDGKKYFRTPTNRKIDGKRAKETAMIYPSSLIACYSGEDLRLWHCVFEDYYMRYFSQAVKNQTFSPRLIYVNKYCWKIAFIALLCSDKIETKEFLEECLNIQDVASINCCFSYDSSKMGLFTDHQALIWFKRIQKLQNESDDNVINANVIKTIDMSMYGVNDSSKKAQYIFQYLYLLTMPMRNPDKGQMVDKLITNIRIEIDGINFDDLSEGEKKMVLIGCVTQVLGDEKSLVLLDEPDAHTHVARKRDLLEAVASFGGQTILTTHSPMFANIMKGNNLFPIDKGILLSNEKRSLIQKLANNEINIIDGACIISSKNLIITEGPDDIFHIKKAISIFSSKNDKYKSLQNVQYLFMGGAKEVQHYYDEVIKELYPSISNIIFAFDNDNEGREGGKMVQKLIDDEHCSKFKYIFYNRNYSVQNSQKDFYLEDFFKRESYNEVMLPTFSSPPSYAELKKSQSYAESIKKKIQKKKNDFKPDEYEYFEAFLDQLIQKFGF